ncbi:MAG: glycerate kinase [Gemmatimonadaceae bacterium]
MRLFRVGIEAVGPAPALRDALDNIDIRRPHPVSIIALGKAAHPMARAAVEWLARKGIEPAGGVIIAPNSLPSPHESVSVAMGNHPIPGTDSFSAAGRLAEVVARVPPDAEVWVLLSGGASSLCASPAGSFTSNELVELYKLLLGSGLDIVAINAVRKRFSRWGAGRLAAALQPALIRCYVISDVVSDDLAAVGSGPCVADEHTAADIRRLLETTTLWNRIPPTLRSYLMTVEGDATLETPKPGAPAFRTVETTIIANNRKAVDAVAARARRLGFETKVFSTPLEGNAASAGERIASTVLAHGRTPACLIWGGETTVALGTLREGAQGGRCQELALSAARKLASQPLPLPETVTILAAGTDGRDGPTDAAGAIVNASTWSAIISTGRDPGRDLAAHDSYPALKAAGALIHTGNTETNVMDVVIAIRAA